MSTTTAPTDAESSTLRERKKQQTRQAIHEAAMRLVAEHGVGGVTIETICADADVSSRTFFNYFPSKSAAALGLPGARISDEARAAFRAGDDLVGDLCDLIGSTVDLHGERDRLKRLVTRRPELVPAMFQWMAELRSELAELAADRGDAETVRLAIGLVLAAVGDLVHHTEITSNAELAVRLRGTVAALGELARSVSTA